MITATCINNDCSQHNVACNVLGAPERTMCGACGEWCELTDERDDPPMPDDLPVGV